MAQSYGEPSARMLPFPANSMDLRMIRTTLLPLSAALALAFLGSCDKPAQPAAGQAPPPAKKDDVKIAKENWPNGKLKFYNELRRNPDGKWAKNGIGRAYYDHGVLEREGMYRNDERVGEWKYYDQNGALLRVEQRGEGKT